MITSLKTKEGYIYALIEWETVNENGNSIADKKEYALVKYAWIHENHRFNGAIHSMVNMMCKENCANGINFVGWERGEKHKQFRWYPVYRILRRI